MTALNEGQLAKGTKGSKTQLLIIQKAIQLFAKQGYENTSLQMIADVCGISRAAPLYHFKTKFGLYEAIVRHLQDKKMNLVLNSGQIRETDNGYQKLIKFFKGLVGWTFIASSEAEIFLLLYYFAAHDSHFARLYLEVIKEEHKIIEEYLLAGQLEGHFRFTETVQETTAALHDLIVGSSVNLLAGRYEATNMREVERKVINLVNKLTNYHQPE